LNSQQESFRSWKSLLLDDTGWLSSPSQTHDWIPRQAHKAYCGRAHELRDIPYTKCGCGIYGVKSTELTKPYHIKSLYGNPEFKPAGSVLVQIAMWGWIHEGSTGYRSQYAYPTAIVCPKSLEPAARVAGEMYEVPVTTVDDTEWQEVIGRKPPRPKLMEQIEHTVYTQEEVRRALRQDKRHKLYMQIRNQQKHLDQLNARLLALPGEIKYVENLINRMKEERNAL